MAIGRAGGALLRRFARKGALGRSVLVLGACLALSGCAGEGPFGLLGPKVPEVPVVPAGQYPSFGKPDIARAPTLDAKGQERKESELEALARQTQTRSDDAAKESQ